MEHAHRLQITALDTAELHGRTVLFTGSLDGTIRVWSYDAASAQFQFHNTLEGHIRGAWDQEQPLRRHRRAAARITHVAWLLSARPAAIGDVGRDARRV
jgi:hypothetical protein